MDTNRSIHVPVRYNLIGDGVYFWYHIYFKVDPKKEISTSESYFAFLLLL